jgi:hypothetical protein
MGVPGLWDVSCSHHGSRHVELMCIQLLRPAAVRTSLSTLAKDAFYANNGGLRALKLGVDASLVDTN